MKVGLYLPFDASIILAAIVYIRISIILTVIMATYNSKNGLGGDRDTSFSLGLQIFLCDYFTTQWSSGLSESLVARHINIGLQGKLNTALKFSRSFDHYKLDQPRLFLSSSQLLKEVSSRSYQRFLLNYAYHRSTYSPNRSMNPAYLPTVKCRNKFSFTYITSTKRP